MLFYIEVPMLLSSYRYFDADLSVEDVQTTSPLKSKIKNY